MLEFPKKIESVTLEGVSFPGVDEGTGQIVCFITIAALQDRFGAGDDYPTAFQQNRYAIELAASDKHEAGKLEADGSIRLIASDFS